MIEASNQILMMLPIERLEAIEAQLKNISDLVLKRNTDEANSEWIESGTARKMLGVSQKTWQTYRDERRIPFSQFGRKIYVKRSDLESFMESHYVK